MLIVRLCLKTSYLILYYFFLAISCCLDIKSYQANLSRILMFSYKSHYINWIFTLTMLTMKKCTANFGTFLIYILYHFRHFNRVTKDLFFKTVNLRRKANCNFRGKVSENNFSYLKLY